MKNNRWIGLAAAAAVAWSGMTLARADIPDETARAYPAAPDEPLSQQFAVRVNQQDVPVYLTLVPTMESKGREGHDFVHYAKDQLAQASFASFDLRGVVHVTVTCPDAVGGAKILPTSRGITPRVDGKTVTFDVDKPGQLVLEINGDWARSLQLFANPWEENVPDPKDPNVIYIGPGIHKVSHIDVKSGQTLYIAPDAVIYGTMDETNSGTGHGMGDNTPIINVKGDHITVRGRGIIDGSLAPHFAKDILMVQGRDISVEGVILRDAGQWTMPIVASDRVTVKNVKILGHRGNSDGIDVNSSRDVDISDSYIRTGDDLIVLKTRFPEKGETRRITAERCVLWNELAHALSVGAEIRQDITDVHFSDCDVIHDKGREWLLRVFHCNSKEVRNVTFDHIRIEECQRLISLDIEKYVWSKSAWAQEPGRGHIDDVVFQDITSPVPERGEPYVQLKGFDADHAIHGVKLDRVTVGGRPLTEADVKAAFADGVAITP